MNRKQLSIFLIVALSLSAFPIGLFAISVIANPTTTYPDYQAVDWQSGLAGDVVMPEVTNEFSRTSKLGPQTAAAVGDVVYDWYLSAIQEDPYMTCRAVVGNVEVWVANNLSFPYGDPRNDPNSNNLNITDTMCEYLANEFNDIIYPKDTTYFGMPEDRDGTNTIFERLGWPDFTYDWINTDTPQRTIIKVLNIQDENYIDPTYPYFVIGFFSPTYDGYYDRNMIHIDAWQWWRRIGNAGDSWLPDLVVPDDHAHDYESTIAHEYQHLIHADWNPSDDTFMNEGCSMYAELLCGYGVSSTYFNSYFATPDNSLTVWGDQGDINILADYGGAALWTIYLSDHYGGADLIRHFVQAGIPGIDGINAALQYYGYRRANFNTVFHDWRLANLIRSKSHCGCCVDKYGYKSIDLNAPEIIPINVNNVAGKYVPWTKGTDFGNTNTILGYDTGFSMIGPFGSDYIQFDDLCGLNFIYFDGDNYATLDSWVIDDTYFPGTWWSGQGDLVNRLLYGEVNVVAGGILSVNTIWDMEDYWDFGFVQVSTDGGNSWTSIADTTGYATYDHDPDAHPDIVANLPGITSYTPSWPDFTTLTYDLSAYAGQTVLIGFRYMTDWATNYGGWWIESVYYGGAGVVDGGAPANQQITLMPWTHGAEVNYMVTLVKQTQTRYGKVYYIAYDMWIWGKNDMGITFASLSRNDNLILVVTPMFSSGFTDYRFKAFGFCCRCPCCEYHC
jgi:immune inhibitor A